MADIEKNFDETEEVEVPLLTLTDEETGEEKDFELLAEAEIDGKRYFALVPAYEESEEYVILRAEGNDDEMTLESIEDDEEFERAADYFDDMLFNEEE